MNVVVCACVYAFLCGCISKLCYGIKGNGLSATAKGKEKMVNTCPVTCIVPLMLWVNQIQQQYDVFFNLMMQNA